MILNGFSLEVLVGESPLVEYTIPDSAAYITTTGKSYTLEGNSQQPTFSDLNTYIVAEPGRKFKLRFFSAKATSKNPIMAETLIDGQFDKTYRGLKSRTVQLQECFLNATRDKKLEFAFSNSIYDDSSSTPISTSSNSRSLRGGIGAISIYFYKGRSVPRQNTSVPSFDIQQIKVKENKKTFGIQCTTAFVPQNVRNHVCYYDMVKGGNDPIAVLHLHYRPASWFVMRGFQVQTPPSFNLPFNGGNVANQINNLSPNNNKKDDGIKLNSAIKSEIKNENDHNNRIKIEKENNRNNKRPFNGNDAEIDVIDLTSDDVENAGTVEKRARVMDWLSKI